MQSYFGSLSGGDGMPLLEDAHGRQQGDVGRPLDISGPLSQIAIQNSSPTSPSMHDQTAISLQNTPLFGEEDLFMCGRCKQQFVDLQIFLDHKKEGCSTGQRQAHHSREQPLPVLQLPGMPNNHFQHDRKSAETFSTPTVLISPSQNEHQPHTLPLNVLQCSHETLESSTGLNLTQNSQREKHMISEVSRSIVHNEHIPTTAVGLQSGMEMNHITNSVQVQCHESELLQSNIVPVSRSTENIVLADDMLVNSSPRHMDFIPDLQLSRFQETELSQQQLNALGMGVLSNSSVASLLQQIPTQTLIQQQQQQQQISLNTNQQQQVYIHIPAQPQPEAQKLYSIQPRPDAANQNYTVGLNLSAINVTPLTLTTSNGVYTVQEDVSQNPFAAQNLSKETQSFSEAASLPISTARQSENISVPQTSSCIITRKPRQSSKVFHCQYCSKAFPRTYDLEQHIRSHTGEKPFQCIVCGRAFAQKSNVKKHMETHKVWPKQALDVIPGIVIVPRENADQDAEKAQNMEVEHDSQAGMVAIVAANTSSCPFCNQVLGSYKERKSHMLRHKDKQVYKCVKDGCDQTFPGLDDYVEHVKTHEGCMTYRCHHCHKLFDTLHNLGIHQYQAHLNDKSKTGKFGKRYRCKICPSKFSHPELLQKHMAGDSHNHQCSFCRRSFVCERYLRKHLNSEHSSGPKKRYKCSECGKLVRSAYYLQSHMLIHTKETPFKCEVCPAAFNRKDKLVRHMVTHDPNKKYKCPFRETLGCPREFNRPDKLKAHIICHNGIRAHKCSFCPKRYTRKAFKIAHEKSHSDEFRCKTCAKGFRNQKQLNTHKCRPPVADHLPKASTRKKTSARPNTGPKATSILNLPDEPMYAIRSGSKRRHLRRNAASKAKMKSAKTSSVSKREHGSLEPPSQDEASTEESEIEVDVEAE